MEVTGATSNVQVTAEMLGQPGADKIKQAHMMMPGIQQVRERIRTSVARLTPFRESYRYKKRED